MVVDLEACQFSTVIYGNFGNLDILLLAYLAPAVVAMLPRRGGRGGTSVPAWLL